MTFAPTSAPQKAPLHPILPKPVGNQDENAAGAFNFVKSALALLTGAAFLGEGANPLFALATLPILGTLFKASHKD